MEQKEEVLNKIASGSHIIQKKRGLVEIDNRIIHYRFKSRSSDSSGRFPFNINPTTLAADFEVWICGNSNCYYLIPKSLIKMIYDDPDTYTNKTPKQESMKTITVDTIENVVKYGRNGKQLDVGKFKNKKLADIP